MDPITTAAHDLHRALATLLASVESDPRHIGPAIPSEVRRSRLAAMTLANAVLDRLPDPK